MHFNTKFLLSLLTTVSQFGSSLGAGWIDADSNWMNFINGNWKLNQINIPGTHDTGTYNIRDDHGWFIDELKVAYARTQNLSIMKQLESGIRYLDIRLGDEDDDDVIIVHGDLYGESLANGKNDKGENLTLKQVLTDCRNFLNTHITETIIIHLKNESNCKGLTFFDAHTIGIDSGKCVNTDRQKIVNDLTSNKSYYFTENRMPRLNEVRGKVVVATRETDYNGMSLKFPGGSKEINLCSNNPSYKCAFDINYRCCIQDAYELAENEKWEAIRRVIDEQNKLYDQGDSRIENNLDINFMSTSKGTLELVANSLKKKLMNGNMLQANKQHGWIIVDFADAEIARYIYKTNQFYRSGQCGPSYNNISCLSDECCSKHGYCGKSNDYCDVGCQPKYGICGTVISIKETATSSEATYTSSIGTTKDGKCGKNNGLSCHTGQCCSKHGYCGTSSDYCGNGCQSNFGKCN